MLTDAPEIPDSRSASDKTREGERERERERDQPQLVPYKEPLGYERSKPVASSIGLLIRGAGYSYRRIAHLQGFLSIIMKGAK